jgi:hypothetical protein
MALSKQPKALGSTMAARCWTTGEAIAPRRETVGSISARPVERQAKDLPDGCPQPFGGFEPTPSLNSFQDP